MENKSISTIKGSSKNPRKITEKMFTLLGETIKEYGDLSGIVVNVRTGEVVGGNQRTAFFKQNEKDCSVSVIERFKAPTKQGTVATGYVEFQGEKFAYREVDWDEKKVDRANIIANKVGGFWDTDMLANQFDIEDLKMGGFEDFELGFFDDEIETDNADDLTKTMDSYLDGSIKQIVLYFKNEEYAELIPRLENLVKEMGFDNYSDLFLQLLNEHENSTGTKVK